MFNQKLLIVFFSLVLSACASVGPKIQTNSLAPEQLSQFKTFNYFELLDTDERYETLLSQVLKKQTTYEMTQRGFKLSHDQPDLLVNFTKKVEDKQEIRYHPIQRYSLYGRGFYDVWTDFQAFPSEYQQGTLSIDIVDRKQNKVVWQGIAIDRVQDLSDNTIQDEIPQVVSDIFNQFPTLVSH